MAGLELRCDAMIDEAERLPARRAAIRRVVTAAVLSRVVVALGVWAGTHFPRADKAYATAPDGHLYVYSPWRLLDGLARWDSDFYLRIAAYGYRAPVSGPPYDAAFFPLFPALIRLVATVTGCPLVAAGVIVSLACFGFAVAAVFLLFEDLAGPERAAAALVALLVFPASFFLDAVYTESLFLMVTAAAVLAARRRHFVAAAIAAALAAVTRPNGAVVAVPVAIEAFVAMRGDGRIARGAWNVALAVGLPAAALALHMWHLGQAYGDPLAFIHVQAIWHRGLAPPWRALLAFAFDPEYYLVALGWMAAVIWALRRLPVSLQAYAALSLALPLCSGTLKSFPRFAAVCFPVFLAVEAWTRGRRVRLAYVTLATMALAVYAFRFGHYDAIN